MLLTKTDRSTTLDLAVVRVETDFVETTAFGASNRTYTAGGLRVTAERGPVRLSFYCLPDERPEIGELIHVTVTRQVFVAPE